MIRKFVSKAFVLLVLLAGAAGVSGCLMTVEQEIVLGRDAAPQFQAQGGGAFPNAGAQRYIREVGYRLTGTLTPEEMQTYQFTFVLLNSPIVNAFALPGGPIFITRGLLIRFDSEDQLAGVLGHEIGHVVHRHTAYRIQRAMGYNFVLLAINIALQVGGGPPIYGDVSSLVLQLADLKYGRDDESESDLSGAEYMVRAGYDPRGLIEVMKVLRAASGGASPLEFFSTHPDPDNRIAAIDELIKKKWPAKYSQPTTFEVAAFQNMLAAAGLGGSNNGYAINTAGFRLYQEGLAAKKEGNAALATTKFQQAEAKYTLAISTLKTHALPYVRRAQVRQELGRMPEALADLDTALGYESSHFTARLTRAVYRLSAGRNADAVSDLDLAIKAVPTYNYSYFYRGKAHYRLGAGQKAVDDLQRFLQSVGEGKEAVEARSILKQLGV